MTALASLLALVPSALAGWNVNSKQNIAVYWGKYFSMKSSYLGKSISNMRIGQNSANSQSTQQRLSFYCNGTSTKLCKTVQSEDGTK